MYSQKTVIGKFFFIEFQNDDIQRSGAACRTGPAAPSYGRIMGSSASTTYFG